MDIRKLVKKATFMLLSVLAVIIFSAIVFPVLLKVIAWIIIVGCIAFVVGFMYYITSKIENEYKNDE